MSALAVLDSEGMFAATTALPEQLDAAITRAERVELAHLGVFSAITVLGMGGSSVAGEVLAAIEGPTMAVPVVTTDGYELPGFVGPTTLVVAVSYSGETEETLEAATRAASLGCGLVLVTSGGALARLAEGKRTALFQLPRDVPEPRCALGSMVAPVLVSCERLGLLQGATSALRGAVAQLRARRDELVGDSATLAVEIARRIGRSFPLVYGSSGVGAVAARRWKTQVNENAKTPAFFAVQPELCHNEVAGFGIAGDVTRQVLTLVNLRCEYEHRQIPARFSLVSEALREVMSDVIEVEARGESAIAQFFDLALLGDFVSLHLAAKEGVDPGPVPALSDIKAALRALDAGNT